MKDFYQALGISENATQDQIKKAYRDIAKKYHPDKNPNNKEAEDKFKAASEAYDTLGDTDKRTKYDQLRKLGAGGFGGSGFGFGGGSGNSGYGGNFQMDYDEFMRQYGTSSQRERAQERSGSGSGGFSFDDIFSNLFGGGRSAQTKTSENIPEEPQPTDDPFFKRKGNDAYIDVTINVIQAMLGSKIRVRTPSQKKVTVKIPAGIDPGKTLRIPQMGFGTGRNVGDMFIRVNVTMPKHLTEEQIEATTQLALLLGLKH